ncbi:hypothetical protein ACRRTK_019403 [Alexandromys fortis]
MLHYFCPIREICQHSKHTEQPHENHYAMIFYGLTKVHSRLPTFCTCRLLEPLPLGIAALNTVINWKKAASCACPPYSSHSEPSFSN